MQKQTTRSARIEARISPEMLEIVKRAAEIQGRSISDFVVTAAQDAARQAIERTNMILLSMEDQRRLVEALTNPPEPNTALRKAKEAHKRLVGDLPK